jgi:hypothetical protein
MLGTRAWAQDVQGSVLQWPGDWVASELGWSSSGPSASQPSVWSGPSGAFEGGEAGTSSNDGATWNGIFSSSSSGPQGTQVLDAAHASPCRPHKPACMLSSLAQNTMARRLGA